MVTNPNIRMRPSRIEGDKKKEVIPGEELIALGLCLVGPGLAFGGILLLWGVAVTILVMGTVMTLMGIILGVRVTKK